MGTYAWGGVSGGGGRRRRCPPTPGCVPAGPPAPRRCGRAPRCRARPVPGRRAGRARGSRRPGRRRARGRRPRRPALEEGRRPRGRRCPGVAPARMRAWMTRGGSGLPRPSIAPSRASPRAAARTRSSIGSSKRSISSDPSVLSAVRIRLLPSSESATRRSVRMWRPPVRFGAGGPRRETWGPRLSARRRAVRQARPRRRVVPRFVASGRLGAVIEPLSTDVRLAVTEIAGTAGAWCPALSPEGDRIAYVTDRSGLPRLETASLTQETPPAVLSCADEEVVSVAWSPDGAWLAYLVSPGGSICAELHVVRPDGSDHRVVAGADPFATGFAGGWTRPGHYVCSIAPGDGPDAAVVLVGAETGARRTLARGGFLAVTGVSGDERWVLV